MSWNDLQGAKYDLQHAWNDLKRPTTSEFWDFFTIWNNPFLFLTRFPSNIWLQLFEHCFVKIIDENRAPNVHTLSRVLITVYKMYNMRHKPLETCKLTFAMQKPALWIKLDIKIKFWRRLNIPGLWKWLLGHFLPKFHHHFHFTSSDFYKSLTLKQSTPFNKFRQISPVHLYY